MNNKFFAVFIFFILFPYIFKNDILEYYNNYNNFNEYSLTSNYNYLNSYSDKINDINNILKTSLTTTIDNSNDVLINNKKLNPFDKMNYKKAFLNNLNIQGLQDKYIYKLNQII